MKIYLDNCCLQRPLDDKSQYRNYTEEREQLLGHLTVDEIVAEIQKKRLNGKPLNKARSQLRTKAISETV